MMLDIFVNNNWKRPIYFSPGAFGDDDYIWMKEYLQLEGLVYKLVPIRTPIPKDASLVDMGRIDSELMYKKVMSWDWGNSDGDIYHDPETRRECISYRTNLGRLMEQLILENKIDKAKTIIELAMKKMPLEKFGYYTALEPFASGYYKVGEKQKARQLLTTLMTKYKEQLKFFSGMKSREQDGVTIEIQRSLIYFKSLLEIAKDQKDIEFFNKNKPSFDTVNKTFERFGIENDL